MKVTEAIVKRRSVKAFDPQHKMTEQEIAKLMSLAMLSPTAFNIQNWRFVVVTDAILRQQIRAVSWNQAQVEEASLLIILTADLNSWAKQPERYWENAPKPVQDYLVPAIGNYYKDHEQVQRDEAMRSCGMAAKPLCLLPKKWATTLAQWTALILMQLQNSSTCLQTTFPLCLSSSEKH